ncbi:MAG: hypothetical protein RL274_1918 [Pseudomonadota bacterium]|jgi:hypothetical protein
MKQFLNGRRCCTRALPISQSTSPGGTNALAGGVAPLRSQAVMARTLPRAAQKYLLAIWSGV